MSIVRGRATIWMAAVMGAFAIAAVAAGNAAAQPADPNDPDYQVPPYSTATDRAREYNVRAVKAYNLGKFQKAVDLYTKAYEELPDGAFLFNIAQSYRQLDNCKQALFFYKRFLAVKKDVPAATKKEVEGHIGVLEDCVKKQDDIRKRGPDTTKTPEIGDGEPSNPPDNTTTGTGTGTTTGTGDHTTTGTGTGTVSGTTTGGGTTGGGDTSGNAGGGDGDQPTGGGDRVATAGGGGTEPSDDGDVDKPVTGHRRPHLIVARVGLGAAMPSFGDLPVDVPAQFSFALGIGYPIALGPKLMLDVGPTIALTHFPWASADDKGGSNLLEVVADVGLTVAATPKIGVRADVGGGVLLFSGLTMGNPFTDNGDEASGALSMPHFRGALTGEYAVNDKLAVQVTPIAFGYSPAKTGLKDAIGSITQLQFTAGLSFRQ